MGKKSSGSNKGLLHEPLHRELNYRLIEALLLTHEMMLAWKYYDRYQNNLEKIFRIKPDIEFQKLLKRRYQAEIALYKDRKHQLKQLYGNFLYKTSENVAGQHFRMFYDFVQWCFSHIRYPIVIFAHKKCRTEVNYHRRTSSASDKTVV